MAKHCGNVDEDGNNIIPYLFPYQGTPDNSDGTLQLYYITVYSAAPPIGLGTLQFTVPSWPNLSASGDTSNFTETANQLSNPQFVEVSLDDNNPLTISLSGVNTVTNIAPGWDLVTTGTGTVTIEQVALDTVGILTKPPYALSFSGWTGSITSARLSQTLEASPGLLAGGAISAYMLVASDDAATHPFRMDYVPSSGSTTQLLIGASTADGAFTAISASVAIDIPDNNSDLAPDGNVKIQVVLPINAAFSITSLQIVGVNEGAEAVPFIQESTARQIDHLFHYYKNPLIDKPIPSYLVGWDFALNPSQALGPTVTPVVLGGVNLSRYIADQTILFSSVDNSFTSIFDTGGLSTITGVNSSSLAFIQYLTLPQTQQLLENRMSVEIQAGSNISIPCEINLYATSNAMLPDLNSPTCETLLTAVSATGVQTVLPSWTKIQRPNRVGDARFMTGDFSSNFYQVNSFNGWDARFSLTNQRYFAIVVSFGTLAPGNDLVIRYVSLCAGDIATRPAPQTPDQVLEECEYYYEKSYDTAVIPGTANIDEGLRTRTQTIFNATNVYPAVFSLDYHTEKWFVSPNITFYDFPGTANRVTAQLINNNADTGRANNVNISNWNQAYLSSKSVTYGPANATAIKIVAAAQNVPNGWIEFQYVVDSRLGIVNV